MNMQKALEELKLIKSKEQLEGFFQKYLGKKGLIKQEFTKLKKMSPEQKKEFGGKISEMKNILSANYLIKEQEILVIEINKSLENDVVDISIEGKKKDQGDFSLLAKTRRELEDICRSMGFIVEYGNELVTKYENFESVNIPLSHPATEMHDTFYIDHLDSQGENMVFRTHTSAMQNALIKKYGAPLNVVVPGRCYRSDELDATHDTMFYHIEGIYIDKNISIANFKSMITKLLSAIIKNDVEIRMRPAYFPFVEPGFEIDARYEIKNPKNGKKTISDWIELMGAGMIHPNVIIEAGLDPSERSGFAFGIGINRLVAIRHGIKDIRYFTNGDLRFAKSF